MAFGHRDSPEHYNRLRDALNASRRALVAMGVAISCAVLGASGISWAFLPALGAAVFAVADALLAWQGYRAAEARELDGFLSGSACRVSQARAVDYGVGVEALPDGQVWRYVQRDFDQDLHDAVVAALSGQGPRLVVLSGDTKSGKTRSAFQALQSDELSKAWLVVPRDGASVERLLRLGVLPRSWKPVVIWLDDLERYASVDCDGLHEGALRNLKCDRPMVVLATVGGRRGERFSRTSPLVEPVDQLRDLGKCIEVPVKLTEKELGCAETYYGRALTEEVEEVGLGRRMVAMSVLREELKRLHEDCPEGFAIVRAAIDWRRAGAQRPLSADRLQILYRQYLPDDIDHDQAVFAAGLKWACKTLPSIRISLIQKVADDGGYEPYDLAVEVAREWSGLNARMLAQIIDVAEPLDCFQMACTAYDNGNSALALEMLAQAELSEDRRLSATSAFNTGVLFTEADAITDAEIAYRRADSRGSRRGAFNLGQILSTRGDTIGAEWAYQRADERGSAEAAVNLGVLFEGRGDITGALAAYDRAKQRGSRKGESNLQRLLAERAQWDGPRSTLDRTEGRWRVKT